MSNNCCIEELTQREGLMRRDKISKIGERKLSEEKIEIQLKGGENRNNNREIHPFSSMSEENDRYTMSQIMKPIFQPSITIPATSTTNRPVVCKLQLSQVCKLYRKRNWINSQLMMQPHKISLFEMNFHIAEICKIKILPSNANKSKAQTAIKIQVKDKTCLISLPFDKKINQLPVGFFLFASIVDKKIEQKGLQMANQQKLYENSSITKHITDDSYTHGTILKKSQHLGKWNTRFIVIKKDGIYSYLNENKQSYSFSIASNTIRYLWTRFDTETHYLIIKIKHNITKTQFAIPITQFTLRLVKNWLYAFFRIMPISTL